MCTTRASVMISRGRVWPRAWARTCDVTGRSECFSLRAKSIPSPRGPMSPARQSPSPDDDPDAFHEPISRGLGQSRESTDIRTFTILGLPIAAVTFDQALQLLLTAPAADRRVSVHF